MSQAILAIFDQSMSSEGLDSKIVKLTRKCPLKIADIMALLKIPRQRVSETVRQLRNEGRVSIHCSHSGGYYTSGDRSNIVFSKSVWESLSSFGNNDVVTIPEISALTNKSSRASAENLIELGFIEKCGVRTRTGSPPIGMYKKTEIGKQAVFVEDIRKKFYEENS